MVQTNFIILEMKNREKIINTIKDCSLEQLDLSEAIKIASLNDEQLIQYLALELYSMRHNYNSLLEKAFADQSKMLEKIKELEIKIAIKEIC